MKRLSRAEQMSLVAECRASGLSAKVWCEQQAIVYKTYMNWSRNANQGQQEPACSQWAEISVTPTPSAMEIHCGKCTLTVKDGFNPQLLGAILHVMQQTV